MTELVLATPSAYNTHPPQMEIFVVMVYQLPDTVKRHVYESLEQFSNKNNIDINPLDNTTKQALDDRAELLREIFQPCEFHFNFIEARDLADYTIPYIVLRQAEITEPYRFDIGVYIAILIGAPMRVIKRQGYRKGLADIFPLDVEIGVRFNKKIRREINKCLLPGDNRSSVWLQTLQCLKNYLNKRGGV